MHLYSINNNESYWNSAYDKFLDNTIDNLEAKLSIPLKHIGINKNDCR